MQHKQLRGSEQLQVPPSCKASTAEIEDCIKLGIKNNQAGLYAVLNKPVIELRGIGHLI